MANFVKVKVSSPHINLSLFVTEKEIGKKLKEIQELHGKTPVHMEDEYKNTIPGLSNWVNKNYLSVTMKRVRIADGKARRLKEVLTALSVIPPHPGIESYYLSHLKQTA